MCRSWINRLELGSLKNEGLREGTVHPVGCQFSGGRGQSGNGALDYLGRKWYRESRKGSREAGDTIAWRISMLVVNQDSSAVTG